MQDAVEMFLEPGQTYLSPTKCASTLELDLQALAHALGVHVNTMRWHLEKRPCTGRLWDYVRVFTFLLDLNPDLKSTAFHMKNTPVRVLGHRTLFEAVRDGDTITVMQYLKSISSGQNG